MTDEHEDRELGRMAAEIERASRDARRYRMRDFWSAYPKQLAFFATGRFRERGLFAGTQLGKTEAGAFETACHLTGEYPTWWPGRVIEKPARAWCAGQNLKMVRDIMQKKLCGEPNNIELHGTGMIPKHLFVGEPVLARGEGGAYDTINVRHRSGGVSVLRFRTYAAGPMALQGETLDFCWADEEPEDAAVYNELLARTVATGGFLMITFTPLKGMTEISSRFREEWSPERTFVQMGIGDIPPDGHIPPEERAARIASYAEHEREARTRGEPMLGEGKIYRTPEQEIVEDIDPLSFPAHWRWGWGMDIGIDHPWAACLLAHDVDQDVIHLVAECCMANQTPGAHVAAMRGVETRIFGRHMEFPVAWPADAGTRDKGSGEAIIRTYKQYGLRTMAQHATHAKLTGAAANSLEGGIREIDEREKNNKWKVARGCVFYLQERRLYHRKDGEPVRIKDDTLSAARYGMMMKRFFKPLYELLPTAMGTQWSPPWGGGSPRGGGGPQRATGVDFDPFTGE
jgi:phage terminase large subunit-like protein